MRRFLYLTIFILVVGCGRAQIVSPESGQSPGPEAGEQATRPAAGNTTILADGQLVAKNPALPLSFQSSGRLTAIYFQAGDQVSTGDLIATIDDGALKENVKNAELAVSQADIGLAQEQLALDKLVEWKPDAMALSAAVGRGQGLGAELYRTDMFYWTRGSDSLYRTYLAGADQER
jgi:multidrug efflux pump subunit AcrA (membrane-fusion protein)